VVHSIVEPDPEDSARAQKRLDRLTKPQGSLGRLEELARLVVGMTGKKNPPMTDKVVFTLAADHGVTEEGISAYPKEVTPQMVLNFLRGGAGINVLAKHVGARVVVADVGVASEMMTHPGLVIRKIGPGTRNMAHGPAMTRAEAVSSLEAGIQLFEDEYRTGIDIVGTGDMGIGNTTSSSAIVAALTGREPEEVTGRGTGINEARWKHKIGVIRKALSVNRPDPADAVDVLSKVGGFEIGGLAGIILAAAARRVPVMIDGFISGAAALVAFHLAPNARHYMIASHVSVERGHAVVLERLGLKPLLDLDLRLGEGTGAALGIGLVEAGLKIMTQMATFDEAQVSEKVDP